MLTDGPSGEADVYLGFGTSWWSYDRKTKKILHDRTARSVKALVLDKSKGDQDFGGNAQLVSVKDGDEWSIVIIDGGFPLSGQIFEIRSESEGTKGQSLDTDGELIDEFSKSKSVRGCTRNGTAAQAFFFCKRFGSLLNTGTGMALEVDGDRTSVCVSKYSSFGLYGEGKEEQHWVYDPLTKRIVNPASAKALAVDDAKDSQGSAKLVALEKGQQWSFSVIEGGFPSGKSFELISESEGKAMNLDIGAESNEDGNVVLRGWISKNAATQTFQYSPDTQALTHSESGRVVQISGDTVQLAGPDEESSEMMKWVYDPLSKRIFCPFLGKAIGFEKPVVAEEETSVADAAAATNPVATVSHLGGYAKLGVSYEPSQFTIAIVGEAQPAKKNEEKKE